MIINKRYKSICLFLLFIGVLLFLWFYFVDRCDYVVLVNEVMIKSEDITPPETLIKKRRNELKGKRFLKWIENYKLRKLNEKIYKAIKNRYVLENNIEIKKEEIKEKVNELIRQIGINQKSLEDMKITMQKIIEGLKAVIVDKKSSEEIYKNKLKQYVKKEMWETYVRAYGSKEKLKILEERLYIPDTLKQLRKSEQKKVKKMLEDQKFRKALKNEYKTSIFKEAYRLFFEEALNQKK